MDSANTDASMVVNASKTGDGMGFSLASIAEAQLQDGQSQGRVPDLPESPEAPESPAQSRDAQNLAPDLDPDSVFELKPKLSLCAEDRLPTKQSSAKVSSSRPHSSSLLSSTHSLSSLANPRELAGVDLSMIETIKAQAKQEGRRLLVAEKNQIVAILERRNLSLMPQGCYAFGDDLELDTLSTQEQYALAKYQQRLETIKSMAKVRNILVRDEIGDKALLGLCIKNINRPNQLRFAQESLVLFAVEPQAMGMPNPMETPSGHTWYFNRRPLSFVEYMNNYYLYTGQPLLEFGKHSYLEHMCSQEEQMRSQEMSSQSPQYPNSNQKSEDEAAAAVPTVSLNSFRIYSKRYKQAQEQAGQDTSNQAGSFKLNIPPELLESDDAVFAKLAQVLMSDD